MSRQLTYIRTRLGYKLVTYRPSTVVGSNKSVAHKKCNNDDGFRAAADNEVCDKHHCTCAYFLFCASSLVTINTMKLTGAVGGEQKRHRTHLSVAQIRVMRSCFRNCRNPSLSECEVIASAIGLEKRVVQVSTLFVYIHFTKFDYCFCFNCYKILEDNY